MKTNAALITNILITTTLLSGTILASTLVSADNDSVVDEINITVPVSCTLSGTGQNSHNAEINNGQYNSAIGETTMKAFCNDNNGFAIYAIGYTDNEDGKNVLTNSTLGSTYDIETGTAITGNDSQWAMKLTKLTSPTPTYPVIIAGSTEDSLKEQGDPDYSSFQEVPDDYAKVAYRTSSTDIGTNAEGATLTTTYQAYISKTQPAGTYTGQVKYTLVHPHTAEKPRVAKSIDTATTLQEVTFCSEDLPENQPFVLTDSRDGTSYHVAKLENGKCWLLDNLALDPTDPTVAANMNETNTNASAAAISNYLNGGNPNNTTGWSSTPVADVDTDFSVGGYIAPRINNASKDVLVTGYGPAATDGQSKVGIYYNFCAASVGTYCYEENQGVDVPDTLIDAPEDICPAGWRMPTQTTYLEQLSDDIFNLNPSYYDEDGVFLGGTLVNNLSTSLSGFINDVTIFQGEKGAWWSSTTPGYLKSVARGLLLNEEWGTGAMYDATHNRNNGRSIRCLLKTY